MLKGCYLIMLPGIYYAEKLNRQIAVEWVAAIVNIGLNLWLIPIYGIVGAATATFASYLTLPILAWTVARHCLTVDYQWRRLTWISVSVLTASSLLYWLSANLDEGLLLTVVVNTTVLFSFFGVAYRLLLTASERELIWSKLKE